MLHQFERCRAEQQELPCPVPGPTAFVDQAAQGGKELRHAVDIVDDGQPPCRAAQISRGRLGGSTVMEYYRHAQGNGTRRSGLAILPFPSDFESRKSNL